MASYPSIVLLTLAVLPLSAYSDTNFYEPKTTRQKIIEIEPAVTDGKDDGAESDLQFHSSERLVFTQKDYNLETNFDVNDEHGHLGNIVQSSLSFRKNYQFYDREGNLCSTAYSRLLSFGTLINCSTVMDVYDSNGKQIGLIEGTLLFTTAPAKFYFYNASNKVVGIAYMDKNRTGFTVYDPNNPYRIIASYDRIFDRDVIDHWEVEIIDPKAIDLRVLISFGAFAIDTQETFREDHVEKQKT